MKQWTGLIIVLMLVLAGCEAPKPDNTTAHSGVTNIHTPRLVSPSDADSDVSSEAPAVTSEPDTDEEPDTTP
jgi:hypothetical protein